MYIKKRNLLIVFFFFLATIFYVNADILEYSIISGSAPVVPGCEPFIVTIIGDVSQEQTQINFTINVENRQTPYSPAESCENPWSSTLSNVRIRSVTSISSCSGCFSMLSSPTSTNIPINSNQNYDVGVIINTEATPGIYTLRFNISADNFNDTIIEVYNVQVEQTCMPNCLGKNCGDDSCGGSCGTCSGGQICNSSGVCVTSCVPRICSYYPGQCGTLSNGCGGTISCGCPSGYSCDVSSNLCEEDIPETLSFDGKTTDLTKASADTIKDFTIEIEKYAKIIFKEPIYISRFKENPSLLSQNILIQNRNIEVNTRNLYELQGNSAQLIFKNVRFKNPKVLYNNGDCPESICISQQYNNNTGIFTLNVARFSTFRIVETPYCGDGICSTGEDCSNCPEDCGCDFFNETQNQNLTCEPNWSCNWGDCLNNSQDFICIDLNNCLEKEIKESRKCPDGSEGFFKEEWMPYLLVTLLILPVLIILIIVFIKIKDKPEETIGITQPGEFNKLSYN